MRREHEEAGAWSATSFGCRRGETECELLVIFTSTFNECLCSRLWANMERLIDASCYGDCLIPIEFVYLTSGYVIHGLISPAFLLFDENNRMMLQFNIFSVFVSEQQHVSDNMIDHQKSYALPSSKAGPLSRSP